MKKLMMAILAAGLLSGISYAEGQKEECKFCKTKIAYEEKKLENLKRELNLSDSQVEKVRQLIKEEREAVEKFMKEHKIPLKEATKDGTFKKDTFISTAKENAEKMATIKAQHLEKMFDILDDGQKKKFIQLMEKRFEKMHQKMKEGF